MACLKASDESSQLSDAGKLTVTGPASSLQLNQRSVNIGSERKLCHPAATGIDAGISPASSGAFVTFSEHYDLI